MLKLGAGIWYLSVGKSTRSGRGRKTCSRGRMKSTETLEKQLHVPGLHITLVCFWLPKSSWFGQSGSIKSNVSTSRLCFGATETFTRQFRDLFHMPFSRSRQPSLTSSRFLSSWTLYFLRDHCSDTSKVQTVLANPLDRK